MSNYYNDQWRLPNNENKDKQSNYSMSFDGSSQYIDLGNTNAVKLGAGDFTFSAWINPDSWGSSFEAIYANAGTNGVFIGKDDAGNFVLRIYYVSNIITYSTLPTIGAWTHICVTRDNGQCSLFYNGSSVATATSTHNFNASANVFVGSDNGSGDFNGKIDAVSIFNYALSSSQITTLYGSSSTGIGNPMSLSPKPVFYAPLGDQDAFNGANYLVPNSSLKDYVFDFIPNDYIDLGDSDSFSFGDGATDSPFSLSVWVNMNDATKFRILNKAQGTSAGNTKEYLFSTGGDDKIIFYLYQDNISTTRIGQKYNGAALTSYEGQWVHLVGTYDGSSSANGIKIYLNGIQVDDTPVTGAYTAMQNTNEPFVIGRLTSDYANGKISNAQIFNTALPETGSNSVETLYNNGSPLTSMSGFTSLQGWWKLDASATYDSSTTTWSIPDDSTNSNTGTSSGMTQANLVQSDLSFTSGYSPYALDFDSASSDYIDCGDSDNFSFGDGTNDSPFSVSAWVYFNSASTSAGIIAKYAATNATKEWMIYTSPQNFRLLLQDGAYNNFATATSTTIQTNQWYNIITTYDGRGGANANQGINIYVNGQLQTLSYTGSSNYVAMNNTNAAVRIGRYSTGNYFDGSISNASIWNAALTPSQVTEIYNEGVPSNLNNHSSYSNLVSWWQLGSNTSWVDPYWIALDEKGTNNGQSQNVAAPNNMGENAIVDGVGSYANGLSSGMGGDEVIGDAPYSTANSLSVNMDVLDRVTDTPS